MAFSREDFNRSLDDVEKYLGYLRGFENAWAYLKEVQASLHQQPGTVFLDVLRLEEGYAFPCPSPRFQVKPHRTWWIDLYVDPRTTVTQEWRQDFIRSVQQGCDFAYQDGVAWATGIAAYCRSICDQFVQPDVPTLVDTILALHKDVVTPLLDSPNDDWANLGNFRTQWKGESADEFNVFYDNYNEVLHRHGAYTGLVNVGITSATKVISGTQFGAQFFVDSIVKSLVEQLDEWTYRDMQPLDHEPLPAWVADVVKIGKDAFDTAAEFVPVVGKAAQQIADLKGKYDSVTTLLTDIEEVTGRDLLPEKHKSVSLKTAEEIYTALTTTLYDDYYTAYGEALDQLQQGGTGEDLPDPGELDTASYSGAGVVDQMRDDRAQGDWGLPDVGRGNLAGGADYY